MDKYKIISADDGVEHREVEPQLEIVSTEQEIHELERYANNPHLYVELPQAQKALCQVPFIESSAIVC